MKYIGIYDIDYFFRQIQITSLMGDILEIISHLQQKLQRGDLTLPDISTCKEIATRKLDVLKAAPYPGKRESQFYAWTNDTNETEEGKTSC